MGLDVWKLLVLIFDGVGQTIFVAIYMTVPWWSNYIGRAFFTKSLLLMVLIDVGVVTALYDFYGEDVVLVILYGMVGIGIYAQLFAMIRQRWFVRHGEEIGQ